MDGTKSVLQLYIPSEHTELDYGAGAVPGIRMVTDHHVHLTARDALTTISLGDPGDPGISIVDPPGLQVFTAGEKRETVEMAVEENYKNTKTEVISGRHTQKLFDEHHFGVRKDATYDYEAHRSGRVVGNDNLEVMLDRHATVHGSDHLEVTQDKHETIHGDSSWLHKGKLYSVTYGFNHDLFLGEKTAVMAGLSTSINVGVTVALSLGGTFAANMAYQRSYVGGNKWELVMRTAIAVNNATKITKDKVKVDSATMAYKNVKHELEKGDLALMIRSNSISSSTMMVFK